MVQIMKFEQLYYTLLLLLVAPVIIFAQELHRLEDIDNYTGQNDAVSNDTINAYALGVHMGIINPAKYPFKSFVRDEINIFKDLYKEYILLNSSQPINYKEWLVMNNFGILSDSQKSLFDRKVTKRSTQGNSRFFISTVRKGDILISGQSRGGLTGHAAIMTTDYWVLEMAGGPGWAKGIPDNNRQMSKEDWYEENSSNWITVYRCPDKEVAHEAAIWADREYFNPYGGSMKSKHITYLITNEIWNTNPSYCAKLVMQAYFFGAENKKVTRNLAQVHEVISPPTIPSYFRKKYRLVNKGEF